MNLMQLPDDQKSKRQDYNKEEICQNIMTSAVELKINEEKGDCF